MIRKTLWSVPGLVGTTALLTACGGPFAGPHQPSPTAIPLSSAQLAPYVGRYDITGPVTGSSIMRIFPASGGTVRVVLHETIGQTTLFQQFTLAAKGLQVRQASERIVAPHATVTISAHPQGAVLQEHATVNGRIETPQITLRSPWQVNSVLLAAISGMHLRPHAGATLEDVILQHATSVPLALAIGQVTLLSTPVGKVRCYPVTLSAGGRQQTAWYEVAAPHALIKYTNGPETFMIVALSR